jgi:hypothetical protein
MSPPLQKKEQQESREEKGEEESHSEKTVKEESRGLGALPQQERWAQSCSSIPEGLLQECLHKTSTFRSNVTFRPWLLPRDCCWL